MSSKRRPRAGRSSTSTYLLDPETWLQRLLFLERAVRSDTESELRAESGQTGSHRRGGYKTFFLGDIEPPDKGLDCVVAGLKHLSKRSGNGRTRPTRAAFTQKTSHCPKRAKNWAGIRYYLPYLNTDVRGISDRKMVAAHCKYRNRGGRDAGLKI